MSLVVATYLWTDTTFQAKTKVLYTLADVQLLKTMVQRNLAVDHEFVCVTDRPERFEKSGIKAVRFDPSAHVPSRITAKLFTFHPDFGELVGGDRILVLDLDCAVTGSLDAIVRKEGDVVLWRNPARRPWHDPVGKSISRPLYNGSMVMVEAKARQDIWKDWVVAVSANAACFRHDQDWYSYKFGPHCPYWDETDGVYRLARGDTPGSGIEGDLPDNAKIVFFVGDKHKPWRPEIAERYPWIATYRR